VTIPLLRLPAEKHVRGGEETSQLIDPHPSRMCARRVDGTNVCEEIDLKKVQNHSSGEDFECEEGTELSNCGHDVNQVQKAKGSGNAR